jgi:hypothetical protein
MHGLESLEKDNIQVLAIMIMKAMVRRVRKCFISSPSSSSSLLLLLLPLINLLMFKFTTEQYCYIHTQSTLRG